MNVLAQSIDRCIAETVAGDHDYFEELCVIDRPELWLQVSWDMFNLALVYDTLPELGELPRYVEVKEWSAGRSVMFSHGAHDSAELAGFLLRASEACWGVVCEAARMKVLGNSRSQPPARAGA